MVLILLWISLVFLNKVDRVSGKLHVIGITNYNIEICVVGMMEIVDFPALEHIEFMSEITYHSCLGINHLCIREGVLKNIGNCFSSLSGFNNLPTDKCCQLICSEFRTSGKPLKLFLCDKSLLTQVFPPDISGFPDFRLYRE